MGVKPNVKKFEQDLIDAYGYLPFEFLSEYNGTMKPLTYRCKKCGSEKEIKYARGLIYSKGTKKFEEPPCPNCSEKYNSNLKPENKEKFKQRIKEMSGIDNLYSFPNGYNGNKKEMDFKCNICGDTFPAIPTNVIETLRRSEGKTYYCPNCNKMVRDKRPYEERLKEKNPNFINLEPFVNRETKIFHKCLTCGHEWKCYPYNRLSGEGCPKCANINTVSTFEKDLTDYIKSFYDKEIILNSRNILENGQELDIYLPDLKIAFEIDGTYFHNYEKKGSSYHLTKTLLAEQSDIKLYHIFTSELEHKKELVYEKVKHIMGFSNKLSKIRASKCYVTEIETNVKNEFLETFHLQGSDRSTIKLGLWYKKDNEDILIAIMTFCKPRKALGRNTKNNKKIYDYELSRFAVNTNYQVYGAFDKLFKYFKENFEWKSIITYADRRWSSKNNLYTKSGFISLTPSKPNYWYFNRNNDSILIHRYNFRKNNLKKLFPEHFNKNLSEYEIMKKANYLKIYDCGNFVYEYNR